MTHPAQRTPTRPGSEKRADQTGKTGLEPAGKGWADLMPRGIALVTAVLMGSLVLACNGMVGGAGSGLGEGPEPGVDASVGTNIPSRELCGNEIDDDDDGWIDEDCGCEAGTSRGCYLGPPGTRSIGACIDGMQECIAHGEFPSWGPCEGGSGPSAEIIENGIDDDCDGTTDEPDGICIPLGPETGGSCSNGRDDDCDTLRDCRDPDCHGQPGCPATCNAVEDVCWGDVDDDCDGVVDCDDPDCEAALACIPGPCPEGQTPTYHARDLGSSYGASGISAGDGEAKMPLTCDEGRCEPGLVAVETSPGSFVCMPPPPPCPAGLFPTYTPSGTWRCDPPCEYVIHYGSIYAGRNVCAGRPDVMCGSGMVPTFVFESEMWECRPVCDNGLYDQIWLDSGALVCVPC